MYIILYWFKGLFWFVGVLFVGLFWFKFWGYYFGLMIKFVVKVKFCDIVVVFYLSMIFISKIEIIYCDKYKLFWDNNLIMLYML